MLEVVVEGTAGDVGGEHVEDSSGVSRWMFAMLLLAAFQTCSTGLWSGAYGGRKTGVMRSREDY